MRVRTLGVALCVLAVFGTVSAVGASAHEWRLNGSPLAQSTPIRAKDTVVIKVKSLGVIQDEYECQVDEEGTVGPGAEGKITAMAGTFGGKTGWECKVTQSHGAGCEMSEKVDGHALKLPWDTKLLTGEKEKLNYEISSGGSGTPAVELKCSKFEHSRDECQYPARLTQLENLGGEVFGSNSESNDGLLCTAYPADALHYQISTKIYSEKGSLTAS